jgi:hypothetical protein
MTPLEMTNFISADIEDVDPNDLWLICDKSLQGSHIEGWSLLIFVVIKEVHPMNNLWISMLYTYILLKCQIEFLK